MNFSLFTNLLQIYLTTFGLAIFVGLYLWLLITGADILNSRGKKK